MNSNTINLILNDIGPAKLSNSYDYNQACEDMHRINLLLKRNVFQLVEEDDLKIYHVDVHYLYNKFYKHLTTDVKDLPKIKQVFKKKIKRYADYLEGYYICTYGDYRNEDGKESNWYRLHNRQIWTS